ncbi:MAG: flagellar biosynthesis protein FlhF [Firmicutes bacterium HGW-Firmicutes-12]|nr:MAG: flagellar biosynthesis protein FlhF [Firmicutes bacterium HGW-Firmicutes-12]
MRVKRFVANDIQEAMAKIKSEMGKDAVILHTRYFKEGGILGMFRKSYVEITAALENRQTEVQAKLMVPQREVEVDARLSIPKVNSTDISKIRPIDGYKAMYHSSKLTEADEKPTTFTRLGQQLYERLKNQGVEEKLATKIVKVSLQQMSTDSHVSQEQIKDIIFTSLLKPVKNKSKPVVFKKGKTRKPKIYAMVGPTGVGKTTTIAKIAAMYALMEKKKVAFVTVDTYRIAAVEQLKTIGDIMNVPVYVVYSLNQLEQCLMGIADSDIVFIDTAGRSHKNELQIEELSNYLEIAKPDEIFLALSCTSKYEDMQNILNVYKELDITRLIFTKLDETSYYGSIYNILNKTNYPLAYFTTGQSIPDDIEVADPVKLVQLLLEE